MEEGGRVGKLAVLTQGKQRPSPRAAQHYAPLPQLPHIAAPTASAQPADFVRNAKASLSHSARSAVGAAPRAHSPAAQISDQALLFHQRNQLFLMLLFHLRQRQPQLILTVAHRRHCRLDRYRVDLRKQRLYQRQKLKLRRS